MLTLQKSKKYRSYYPRNTFGRRLWFIVKLSLSWFILYKLITVFLFASFRLDSVSMQPEFSEGDRILVSLIEYGPKVPFSDARIPGAGRPMRGDVVVARPPYYREAPFWEKILSPFARFFTMNTLSPSFRSRESWEQPLVIKRVVGLPGDTIKMEDSVLLVKPEGSSHFLTEFEFSRRLYDTHVETLPENWESSLPFSGYMEERVLGEDEYFLLGDNRADSSDSRHWGPVGFENIHGRVVFRYWPLKAFGAP